MNLKKHIKDKYKGRKDHFAIDMDVSPSQVTRWLSYDCIWYEGAVYKRQSKTISTVIVRGESVRIIRMDNDSFKSIWACRAPMTTKVPKGTWFFWSGGVDFISTSELSLMDGLIILEKLMEFDRKYFIEDVEVTNEYVYFSTGT
jgi:hypothetical protein